MPFTEAQLNTWSSQGAITSSATTYNSIKTCIDSISWKSDVTYQVYLQGSYKNDTNIRGNSDIDVIVEFQSIFYSNKEDLKAEELKEFNEVFSSATYTLESFKSAILKKLKEYYGEKIVIEGNKSIKVIGQNGRLNADVICCVTYREYNSFSKASQNDYNEGIKYFTLNSEEVINFPKLHYSRGVTKNQNTGNYKSSIRIIKNMKTRMVDAGHLNDKTAPSYFIECLLYNIPNNIYTATQYTQIIPNSIAYLEQSIVNASINKFVCQNYQRFLFGNSDQQWQIDKCEEFIVRLRAFWNAG